MARPLQPGDVVCEDESFWLMRGHDGHTLAVPRGASANGSKWEFNGDYQRPTFEPSVREMGVGGHHYIVTDGVVVYCDDQLCPDCPPVDSVTNERRMPLRPWREENIEMEDGQ